MTLNFTMTLHEQFQAAPMTSAERLGALIDAATRYQHLNCKVQNLLDAKDKAEREAGFVPLADLIDPDCDAFDQRYFESLKVPLIRRLSDELDSAIEAECLAQEEVSAWVVTLLDAGTLDYCRKSMVDREALRTAVDSLNGKFPEIFPPEMKIGFFNQEAAKTDALLIKQARQARRKAFRAQPTPITTWRNIERVLIPGYLIRRATRAVTSRLPWVGPEVVKWLEHQDERLSRKEGDGMSPNWWKSRQLALVHWLLQAPDTEPEPTEEPFRNRWMKDDGTERPRFRFRSRHCEDNHKAAQAPSPTR